MHAPAQIGITHEGMTSPEDLRNGISQNLRLEPKIDETPSYSSMIP